MNPPINLSDLEQIITALLSEGKCACHFINPHKTRILLWKLENDTYHLRIGIQRFVSQEQKDRQGATYWRFFDFQLESTPAPNQPEKLPEYGKSNAEPATNSTSA